MKFFSWKCDFSLSDTGYRSLIDRLSSSRVHIHGLQASRKYLQSHLGLYVQEFHRCVNNCMLYVGKHELLRRCHYCETPRFFETPEAAAQGDFVDEKSYANLKPRAVFSYIPVIPRLKLLYTNQEYARKMRYPRTLIRNPWDMGIRDIWDGNAMRHWVAQGSIDLLI